MSRTKVKLGLSEMKVKSGLSGMKVESSRSKTNRVGLDIRFKPIYYSGRLSRINSNRIDSN